MNATTLPDLPSVLDRFEQASTLIASMHQSLQALTETHQQQQHQTDTLNHTSEHIQTMAAALTTAAATTSDAMAETRAALQAARQFLASTDLSQLLSELTAVRQLIDETFKHQIATLETERDTAQQELETIRNRAAALPKRARQQLSA